MLRVFHSHGGWAGGDGGGIEHGSRTSEKSHLSASMSPYTHLRYVLSDGRRMYEASHEAVSLS